MRKIIYSLLFCGLALSASAQDTEGQQIGVYQQAEDNYDIGRLDTARTIISTIAMASMICAHGHIGHHYLPMPTKE